MATKLSRATLRRKVATEKSPAARQKVPAAYAKYLRVALKFPGTEESTSYGTPSVKANGKILSRLRTEAEGALALVCDFLDREMLLQADPDVFFVTDHYRNSPMILIRLEKIRADALPDLVERAWRIQASKKLVGEFDSARVALLAGSLAGRHIDQETYRKHLIKKHGLSGSAKK